MFIIYKWRRLDYLLFLSAIYTFSIFMVTPTLKWFACRLENLLHWCCRTQGSFKFYPSQNYQRHGDSPFLLSDIPDVSLPFHLNGMQQSWEFFLQFLLGTTCSWQSLIWYRQSFIKNSLWHSWILNGYFSWIL